MPLPLIVAGVVAVTALVAVVVAYWPRIMAWALDSLLPWVDTHLPEFAEDVRLAFQDLDQQIVEVRQAIRAAWRRVRHVLLKETADFVRLFNGRWAVQITSYLRNQEQRDKPVVKVVSQQEIDWDDLPDDVRTQLLRDEAGPVDITKIRDELLLEN